MCVGAGFKDAPLSFRGTRMMVILSSVSMVMGSAGCAIII